MQLALWKRERAEGNKSNARPRAQNLSTRAHTFSMNFLPSSFWLCFWNQRSASSFTSTFPSPLVSAAATTPISAKPAHAALHRHRALCPRGIEFFVCSRNLPRPGEGQLRKPEEGEAKSPPAERTSCLQGQSRLGEDEGRSQAGRRACAMPAGCLTLFIINKAGGLIYTRHFSQEHTPLAVNECLR